jgi:4-hydroxyacetophenone monooxygenase
MTAPDLYGFTPITDDDATIAALLNEVSVPTLLCAMVHLTGDPAWIRDDKLKPAGLFLNEYQGFMSEEAKAEARARALPEILAFRDRGGVLPPAPSDELIHEMMCFLGCADIPEDVLPMMLSELNLDGTGVPSLEAPPVTGDRQAFPVVVIGCGQSGLLAGIKLREAGIAFTIIEKNPGPGGTWWENSYPGARVDVGSHFYCYSFEPADHWTEYFSQQPELRQYFVEVMGKYGIEPHCRFNTEVVSADFDEATGTWTVRVRAADGTVDELPARAVISAVGALNRPQLPNIDGIDDFNGPTFHSIRWNHDVDYRGKKFALIGAGATGFQIAPTIADDVEQLTVFQRTAQWMFPNPNYHEPVPDGMKWAIRHLPYFGRWFRFLILWPGAGTDLVGPRIDPEWDDRDGLAVSERNLATRNFFLGFMADQIGNDPELLAKVTPDYPATGKRTLQDNGSWLGCLQKDNVDLVRTGIQRIEPDGVRTVDGEFYEADIICFATGFRHNDFLWPMEIRGRNGQRLNDFWGDEPGAYLGITVPGFPNLFCMYGPGTNLASGGSLIFHSECQISYIMGCIEKMLDDELTALEPTVEAYETYDELIRDEISQMVWSHWAITNSHYKNSKGNVHTLSPWPLHVYQAWTRQPDFSKFVLTK